MFSTSSARWGELSFMERSSTEAFSLLNVTAKLAEKTIGNGVEWLLYYIKCVGCTFGLMRSGVHQYFTQWGGNW